MTSHAAAEPQATGGDRPHASSTRRGIGVYLALAAIPLLAYQGYSLVRWLADGPSQISNFRDTSGVSLYTARAFEVVVILITVAVVACVVAECRRRRTLTFDAVLLLAQLLTIFWDIVVVLQHPIWLYSSNWINLNDWWAHAPFAANAAAGHTPFPIVMLLFTYTGAVFALAVGVNILMDRAQARWQLTPLKLVGATMLFITAIVVPGCYAMNALHLWSSGDMPPFVFQSEGFRVSLFEVVYGVTYLSSMCFLRYFKDDLGLAITERGLDNLGRLRNAARILATTTACSLTVILLSLPYLLAAPWAKGYPDVPDQLIANVCDNNATMHTTAYGPCPGIADGEERP